MKDVLGLGELGTKGTEMITMIYPDLAQPGMKKVGQALETVLDFGNTILLPLKLVNERSKIYFQKHMDSYKEKLNAVPEEEIGTIPPEVGLPILDELLKVTNDDLADLFTSLLVNASIIDKSRHAHPSFINVIKSLSADEARIINFLTEYPNEIIYLRYDRVSRRSGMSIPMSLNINNLDKIIQLDFEDNKAFYMDNLVNLGILESLDNYFPDKEEFYTAIEAEEAEIKAYFEEELIKINEIENPKGNNQMLTPVKGRYSLTKYGKEFLKSISTVNKDLNS